GDIERISFNGYDYSGFKVNGSIAKKQFEGKLETHGEDVDLVFEGGVDLSGQIPRFDFNAQINRLQLNRINLLQGQQQYTLRTVINSDFEGDEIDNLEGKLEFSDVFLQVDQKMYHLTSVLMNAQNLPDKRRSIRLSSDLIDADLEGSFELEALPITFKEIIPRFLPNVLLPVSGELKPQDFNFNIHFKNTSLLTENYLPDLIIDPETRLVGSIKGQDRFFDIRVTSPAISYGSSKWIGMKTTLATVDNHMSIDLYADTMYYSSDGFIPFCSLKGKAASNEIDFRLMLAIEETQSSRLDWKGHMFFRGYDDFDLLIYSSGIMIENLPWQLDPGNMITYDSTGVKIRNVAIHHEAERIGVQGKISKDPKDELLIDLKSFIINHINPAISSTGFSVGGVLSGSARLSELYTSTVLKSDLDIERFVINGDTLGSLSLTTGYESGAGSILIEAEVINGSAKTARLEGKLKLRDKEDALDFRLTTDNFYLHPLEKFADSIITDLRGKVSAELT
ncbi:MAG: hypothetical protein ACKOQ6_11610, partial [Bacteroidota bacterium]